MSEGKNRSRRIVPEQLESEPKKQTPKKSRGPTDEEKPATKRPDMLGNRWAAHPRPDMIGNRLWALRKNHTSGNPRKFQSPEEMRLAVLGYFAWMEGHPLYEAKVVQSAGSPMIISVPRIRAMSQESLCMHIGMSRGAWVGYRTREGFEEIVANTEAAIYAQKFEGAAADLLNSNIITKELGLKERIDHTSGDESVTSITRRIVDCRPPDVRLEEALSDE